MDKKDCLTVSILLVLLIMSSMFLGYNFRASQEPNAELLEHNKDLLEQNIRLHQLLNEERLKSAPEVEQMIKRMNVPEFSRLEVK